MTNINCRNCGTRFVRVTYRQGMLEHVLNQLKIFPFRCQLCKHQFHAFSRKASGSTRAFDRRQYKRLSTSIEAKLVADNHATERNRITDISIDGCSVQATGLPRGTFLGLVLKPDEGDEAINIETAMVCSVRPSSIGVKFLEVPRPDQQRLSNVILGLLVSQSPAASV
ncbi:PilZ domain-containing protein [Petrachloros mirabilis]